MAVPATNVTMLFFNEIEELKKIIDSLTVKNREVQGENDILKKRNQKLQNKLHLIQALTMNSKLMFE